MSKLFQEHMDSLSPKDREQAHEDMIAYGSCILRIENGVMVRVPPDEWDIPELLIRRGNKH